MDTSRQPSDSIREIIQQASSLFLENRSFVRFIALLHAPDRSLIDDIVNDVYLAFVQDAPMRDLSVNIKPLLRTITQRVAASHWRKQQKFMPEYLGRIAANLVTETQRQDTIVGLADADVERMALRICIDKLPDRCKKLIEQHYDEGIPFSKLAEEIGENVNTLYYQITQIRLALKTCIQQTKEMDVSLD